MFRIAVLISGRGSNFMAIYEDLQAHGTRAEFVGVITDNPSAPGLAFAIQNQIPCFVVERKKKEQSQEAFFAKLTSAVLEPRGCL